MLRDITFILVGIREYVHTLSRHASPLVFQSNAELINKFCSGGNLDRLEAPSNRPLRALTRPNVHAILHALRTGVCIKL